MRGRSEAVQGVPGALRREVPLRRTGIAMTNIAKTPDQQRTTSLHDALRSIRGTTER
jgi:hypothetical protein